MSQEVKRLFRIKYLVLLSRPSFRNVRLRRHETDLRVSLPIFPSVGL